MDFQQVLTNIARAIVDNPDSVNVAMTEDGDEIGHHGKIAKAVRSIMTAAGSTCGKRVIVEIQ